MTSRSPFEHIHTIIDSRALGHPAGLYPNDSFFVTAQQIHAALELAASLRGDLRSKEDQGQRESTGRQ